MNISEHYITQGGNFKEGRDTDYPIDMIVIHVEEGTESATESWFDDVDSHVSAHYGNNKLGFIEQFVREEDTAYANGRVDKPTASLVIERLPTNPNLYTISIEHEGDGTEDLTAAQRISTVELIQDICKRYEIPIDRTHIVGHHEIFSRKPCPGKIDVDELVSLASK